MHRGIIAVVLLVVGMPFLLVFQSQAGQPNEERADSIEHRVQLVAIYEGNRFARIEAGAGIENVVVRPGDRVRVRRVPGSAGAPTLETWSRMYCREKSEKRGKNTVVTTISQEGKGKWKPAWGRQLHGTIDLGTQSSVKFGPAGWSEEAEVFSYRGPIRDAGEESQASVQVKVGAASPSVPPPPGFSAGNACGDIEIKPGMSHRQVVCQLLISVAPAVQP